MCLCFLVRRNKTKLHVFGKHLAQSSSWWENQFFVCLFFLWTCGHFFSSDNGGLTRFFLHSIPLVSTSCFCTLASAARFVPPLLRNARRCSKVVLLLTTTTWAPPLLLLLTFWTASFTDAMRPRRGRTSGCVGGTQPRQIGCGDKATVTVACHRLPAR